MSQYSVRLPVLGDFDLAASTRFLEGFAPAGRPDAGAQPGALRLAFPVEGSWRPMGVLVRQAGAEVSAEMYGADADDADRDPAAVQVTRILSLDVDGSGFPALGRSDPVVARLQARYPGLRPVLFSSPYEAACWAVLSQRIRITQASALRQRLADRYGAPVHVGAAPLPTFPGPDQLRAQEALDGVPAVKVQRLHAVAEAALDGRLEANRLRSLPVEVALDGLRQIPGLGPFSADLVLARGAGHPDMFPAHERRLHEEMAAAYGLDSPSLDQLRGVAEGWRPYRTWVALLLRTQREAQRVARLVPYTRPTTPRRPGAWRGRVETAADFDQLPADLEADLEVAFLLGDAE